MKILKTLLTFDIPRRQLLYLKFFQLKVHNDVNYIFVKNCYQILLLILSKFKEINELLFALKSSENINDMVCKPKLFLLFQIGQYWQDLKWRKKPHHFSYNPKKLAVILFPDILHVRQASLSLTQGYQVVFMRCEKVRRWIILMFKEGGT